MAGEFSLFWSIVVPLLLVAGSVVITWVLYRHFAAKVGQKDD